MFSMFKKKKPSSRAPRSLDMTVPTDRIRTLRFQGLSDSSIIKTLREEGYSPLEVDKSMRDSLKNSVSPPVPQTPQTLGQDTNLPVPGEPVPQAGREGRRFVFPEEEAAEISEPPAAPHLPHIDEEDLDEELPPIRPLPGKERGLEKKFRHKRELEETVESVVDEKWLEFERRSGELINKIQQIENKMAKMERFVGEIQSEKKTELEEIKDMIDNYKNSMGEVTGKMDSLERAMKDALTPMMQSLRSLSDTIKLLKGNKK